MCSFLKSFYVCSSPVKYVVYNTGVFSTWVSSSGKMKSSLGENLISNSKSLLSSAAGTEVSFYTGLSGPLPVSMDCLYPVQQAARPCCAIISLAEDQTLNVLWNCLGPLTASIQPGGNVCVRGSDESEREGVAIMLKAGSNEREREMAFTVSSESSSNVLPTMFYSLRYIWLYLNLIDIWR